MANPRIDFIDLAKGLCMIHIVMLHIASFYSYEIPFGSFFYICSMPSFFFLSSCFFKTYDSPKEFLRRKTNKLLVPFVFFYVFTSFGLPHFMHHTLGLSNGTLHADQLFSALMNEDYPNLPIWFLLCLLEANLLFYPLVVISNKLKRYGTLFLCISTLVLGVAGLVLGVNNINLPATLDTTLTALPFFAAGYLTFTKTRLLVANATDRYLPIAILAAFALAGVFCQGFSFRLNLFSLKAAIALYPCGLLGIFGVTMLSKWIKRLPFVSYLGKNSLIVLLTHIQVLNLVAGVLKHAGIVQPLAIYLNLLFTLLLFLVVIPLVKRVLPHVTGQKDLL